MTAWAGEGRPGILPRLTVSTLVVLLTVACTGTPVPDDGQGEAGVATSADETDDTEPEPDRKATATEGSEPTDSTDAGDAPEEEDDPFDEIEWALTPAGPGSPQVNEDAIYKVLDDLDPQACAALLDPAEGWFDPSNFGTGERTVHLFLAGAHLCAGDRESAMASYQQAQALTWDFSVEQPLHSRVCNVWDAVTRIVDPAAGPCALEELSFDDPTDPDDADDAGDAADPDDPDDPDGASEEPTGDATTSESETEGAGQTEEPESDASSESGDEGSSP